jgi:hypothetical protein
MFFRGLIEAAIPYFLKAETDQLAGRYILAVVS